MILKNPEETQCQESLKLLEAKKPPAQVETLQAAMKRKNGRKSTELE